MYAMSQAHASSCMPALKGGSDRVRSNGFQGCAVSEDHTLGGMAVKSAENNHCGIPQSRVKWTCEVEVICFPGSPAARLRIPEDSVTSHAAT